jgi:hypothetical protein
MSNPNVAQGNVRPGLKAGRSNEFTLIFKLKPGGAERMRKKMSDAIRSQDQRPADRIGTLHDMRFVIFDNDYDFSEVEGYPGIHSPDIKDFIVKHQVTATYFYSAYPDTTVRDVWKALKVKGGLDVLLDAASS